MINDCKAYFIPGHVEERPPDEVRDAVLRRAQAAAQLQVAPTPEMQIDTPTLIQMTQGAIHKGRPHREGGSPKADIVREVAWIYSYRSSQNADKGGRGSKILNILRTSFMNGPKGGFH